MFSEFEWDEDKAAINAAKHDVTFEQARLVFFDEDRIEDYDEAHSTPEEQRFTALGLTPHGLLYVVFTERGEAIRIIHARKADTRMEKDYDEENGR